MLINLSNHPSAQWSEAQRTAAIAQFGAIHDLQFPSVPPEATTEEVIQIADDLALACRRLDTEYGPVSVMIAGEQCVMYHTVRYLKAAYFACYAATSERKVVQKSATEKSIEFSFVQFRAI
ncbi:MAG: hypothetical protein RIS47_1084 [Bacteroidota bacterium]|jgi:hypothetical protein